MAKYRIITSLFMLIIAVRVEAQFFDFFSDLRTFTYQTIKPLPFQESTTKKSKITNQRYNGQDQTSTGYRTEERDSSWQITREKARRKTTTTTPAYDVQFLTTAKPRRFQNANNNTKNNYSNANLGNNNYESNIRNYENNNRNYENNNRNYENNNRNYDNNNNDYSNRRQDAIDYTVRPYETTKNYYTTYNPLLNRPGVKPVVFDNNRPPITNRPATQRPLAVYPRPTDESVIRFPEGADTSPPVLTGPDEDAMSPAEQRKYVQIAERMCDKYKSLTVKKLEVIPLLPSPESVQINITECEVSSVPLVVGGKVTNIREFPHMALLGWTKLKYGGYSWKCGGSLVSDRYVLTAAHCSFQNRDTDVVSGAPRVVQLGSSYLDDSGALVIKVSSITTHPKYTQKRNYYDIALVKLARAVTFSAVVRPACLGVPPPVGEKVVATGWGRTEFGGENSLELRSVSLSVWDLQDCRRILGVTRKMPNGPSSDSQICAGEKKGGKDTCQGDSGGPAQIQDGCLWRVVAVTSLGRSCGAINTPAVYAKVNKAFVASQIFADEFNKIDNNPDYGTHNSGSNRDYDSNNRDYGSNDQKYGTSNYDTGSNNRDYGSNNQNSASNRRSYDRQNFGSNFDSSVQNNGNDNQNYDSDYRNNNGRNNNYDHRNNVYNNANNRQTDHNYDNYNNDQESRISYNNYDNRNVNPSTTNNFGNNENQNNNRRNNYDSNRNNNGMVNFDSTSRPSTSNYYANNNRQVDNRYNNYYRKRDDYRAKDFSEDIIHWPAD